MRGVALAHRRRSPKPAVFRGGKAPTFIAPLFTTLVPARAVGSRTPTYTRATTAWVEDHEGILRQVPSGAARFHGARYVLNAVYTSSVEPSSQTGSVSYTTSHADPAGGTGACKVVFGASGTGNRVVYSDIGKNDNSSPSVISIYLRGEVGGEKVKFWDGWSTHTAELTLTTEWTRYSLAVAGGNNSSGIYLYANSGTPTIYAWGAQVEYTAGRSDTTTPSEYVSKGVLSAPYHGAGADGVKYFSTDRDGNPIPDATLKGYLAEGARQNRCLYSQDFSNAAWVATNATKTNTVAAPDGSTTGYTLTATAANGTVIQDLGVVASAAKTFSIWLKRKTGTGNVQMTLDGGATWTTKTITSDWARYSITQTLADEDCGIRIVTSGDAVYVWGAQVETASGFSSYIPTTTAAVTRNADVLKYDSFYATLINAAGSAHAEISRNILDVNGSGIIDLEGDGGTGPLFFSNSTTMQASMHDNTLQASPLGSSTPTVGQIYKSASSWGNSLMRCSSNNGYSIGNDVAFDGSFGAGAFSPGLWIGGGNGGANPMNGMIRNLRLWNTTLSRAALQALTT